MIKTPTAILAILLSLTATFTAGESYFPKDTWITERESTQEERDRQQQFYENWFGAQLAAMAEMPMWNADRSADDRLSIRLLFVPSFSPSSVIKLTVEESGKMPYVFKMLDGRGGYEPGKLVTEMNGNVPPELAGQVLKLVEDLDIWSGKTPTVVLDPASRCTDGAMIIFEFRQGPQYKVIARHNCELTFNHKHLHSNPKIRDLLAAFYEISGYRAFSHSVLRYKN